MVRDSRYIRFISSLIVSWCIFPGEHEALQSGVFLSYEFFWKLLSLSACPLIARPCRVRNCRQRSCSIIPSLLFSCSIRCCLTSCMLTGVWLKKAHFFLIHSLWKWDFSWLSRRLGHFFQLLTPILTKLSSPHFEKVTSRLTAANLHISQKARLVVLQIINHSLFLYHSALKYLSLCPNNLAVS